MSDTNEQSIETAEKSLPSIEDLQAEVARVVAQNKKLIGEKQAARQAAQAAQDAADEAAQSAAERSGDVEALKTSHQRELAKLQQRIDAYDSDLRTIRVDNEIARAITENNVIPELADGFTALVKSRVQYKDGVASAGEESASISEYIAGYLSSAPGGYYRRASDSTGSGATGSDNSKAQTAFTEGEYARRYKLNPAEAKKWAVANGQAWITQE